MLSLYQKNIKYKNTKCKNIKYKNTKSKNIKYKNTNAKTPNQHIGSS